MIVGVNEFTEDEPDEVELQRIDPEVERRQLERTARVRAERDAEAAAAALAEVRQVAQTEANLLPPCAKHSARAARSARSAATLRELWGTYDAQHA